MQPELAARLLVALEVMLHTEAYRVTYRECLTLTITRDTAADMEEALRVGVAAIDRLLRLEMPEPAEEEEPAPVPAVFKAPPSPRMLALQKKAGGDG